MITERQKVGLNYFKILIQQIGYSLDIETAEGQQLTNLARLYDIERFPIETDIDLRNRIKHENSGA